jgi:hypothetical protein
MRDRDRRNHDVVERAGAVDGRRTDSDGSGASGRTHIRLLTPREEVPRAGRSLSIGLVVVTSVLLGF